MKERIETFKDELKHLFDYYNEIKRIKEEINILEYEMENVKGLDYSKQKGNSLNEAAIQNKKLEMIEKMDILRKKLKREIDKVKAINEVLDCMEESEKELVYEVIAKRRKYKEVCEERNINNTSSLFSQINNIISRALKKMG